VHHLEELGQLVEAVGAEEPSQDGDPGVVTQGDGRVVADWAAALGGKAVVTSGYLSYMPGGVALGHETLMKPVRQSDLVAAVEGLIGKALVD
jgi:hypothetical protein